MIAKISYSYTFFYSLFKSALQVLKETSLKVHEIAKLTGNPKREKPQFYAVLCAMRSMELVQISGLASKVGRSSNQPLQLFM